jgi:putative chitinase
MGNGDESSGDGYRYKGRGAIQLTGKSNYEAFDKLVEDDIVANPDLVATKYSLMSAAWFFSKNNLWPLCDKGIDKASITSVTKRVNGGNHGLPDRIEKTTKFYNLLK